MHQGLGGQLKGSANQAKQSCPLQSPLIVSIALTESGAHSYKRLPETSRPRPRARAGFSSRSYKYRQPKAYISHYRAMSSIINFVAGSYSQNEHIVSGFRVNNTIITYAQLEQALELPCERDSSIRISRWRPFQILENPLCCIFIQMLQVARD